MAERTGYTAVVTSLGNNDSVISAVQFVQISRRRALIILILSSGLIKSRIFHCDFDLNNDIIKMLFRAYNEKTAGKKISEINKPFIQSMGASLGEISILASSAYLALFEAANESRWGDVILRGQNNLLNYSEFSINEIRGIMTFFENRERISEIVKLKGKKGISIIIGGETGIKELENCSVIMTDYKINNVSSGVMTIAGPLRMRYKETAAIIRYVSAIVSEMLTSLMGEE